MIPSRVEILANGSSSTSNARSPLPDGLAWLRKWRKLFWLLVVIGQSLGLMLRSWRDTQMHMSHSVPRHMTLHLVLIGNSQSKTLQEPSATGAQRKRYVGSQEMTHETTLM